MQTARHQVGQPSSGVYFCDDLRIGSLPTRKSLSPDCRRSLKDLEVLDTRFNWKALLFVWLWALGGWVAVSTGHPAAFIPAIILMSLALNGMTILMHESCHSLLSKNPIVNRWLGFVCGLPGLVAVSAYRSIHIAHHAHVRTENDPDNIELASQRGIPLVVAYYSALVLGIYLYLPSVAITGFRKASVRARQAILMEYSLVAVVVGLAIAFVPLSVLFTVWILPLLIAAQLSNVRGIAEHGLTTAHNEFTASRTVQSNRFVSFFMCNLNYHLEHHLFPGIPWYNLPKAHRILKEHYVLAGSSVYRTYTRFLIDFVHLTLSQQIVPDVRLIPAHLRDEICA